MSAHAVLRKQNVAPEAKDNVLTGLFERFSAGRFARGFGQDRPVQDIDPYLLILLADNEQGAGRREQAISLIEATYSAFDERTNNL